MSEPETGIKISDDDMVRLRRAEAASNSIEEAVKILKERLDAKEYPSRDEISEFIKRLGNATGEISSMASW